MVRGADARRQLQAEEAEMIEAVANRIYTFLLMGILLTVAVCTIDKGGPR